MAWGALTENAAPVFLSNIGPVLVPALFSAYSARKRLIAFGLPALSTETGHR
jgi:hypothetical protein